MGVGEDSDTTEGGTRVALNFFSYPSRTLRSGRRSRTVEAGTESAPCARRDASEAERFLVTFGPGISTMPGALAKRVPLEAPRLAAHATQPLAQEAVRPPASTIHQEVLP